MFINQTGYTGSLLHDWYWRIGYYSFTSTRGGEIEMLNPENREKIMKKRI